MQIASSCSGLNVLPENKKWKLFDKVNWSNAIVIFVTIFDCMLVSKIYEDRILSIAYVKLWVLWISFIGLLLLGNTTTLSIKQKTNNKEIHTVAITDLHIMYIVYYCNIYIQYMNIYIHII